MNCLWPRVLFALGVMVALSACQALPRHKLHHRVISSPQILQLHPVRLVALPLSVRVKEMTAGGLMDEVGVWTHEAKGHIHAALQSGKPHANHFELVPLGELSEAENAAVEEHIALFDMVAGGAMGHTMVQPVAEAWQPKARRFDYTLGPGLAFLKQKTGADKALIVFGEDVISSAGRKAVFVVAAAFGVGLPLGHSFLIAGLVDLDSGDILWMDYTFSPSDKSFRNRADVDELLTELFTDYPGIESYLEGSRAE